jgi:Secretion system C-terminal sorting domain
MERKLLSATLIGLTVFAHAQLAPDQDAPLYRHLLEVNQEWPTMHPSPVGGERIVHFKNEAERIATHLRMVREHLSGNTGSALSPKAANERAQLLALLGTYADRGLFPQNHVLPRRNPIFIDAIGTACAVGQLMVESGHRDLAQRIANEKNFAYVHDMHRADMDEWASAHGFTENELAWIQPAYPPDIPWAAFGGGTNGEVKELLELANGDMLVAGVFTEAGGTAANHVARYNGSTYTALPGLPPGEINTAIEFNGSIYVGGSFNGGSMDLAKWNGTTWDLEAVFSSKYAVVTDLHVHGGVLHAAGEASGFAGISYEVHRLLGGSWELIGQTLNGTIRSLATFDGALVCGGDFTGNIFSQDSAIVHVAKLNGGVWEQLGEGLNGRVFDMLVHENQLYAGGDCVTEITNYFGMARIATGSSTWEQLMPNIGYYIFTPLDAPVHINALTEHNGQIYFGGDFDIASGLDVGRAIGVFNGTADGVGVMAAVNSYVNDLEIHATNQLVAGGNFTENTGTSTPYIANTDLATAIADLGATDEAISIWPNPATEQIMITMRTKGNMVVTLVDVTGRTVMTGSLTPARTIDVRNLSAGTYTLMIKDGNKRDTATFIKQ